MRHDCAGVSLPWISREEELYGCDTPNAAGQLRAVGGGFEDNVEPANWEEGTLLPDKGGLLAAPLLRRSKCDFGALQAARQGSSAGTGGRSGSKSGGSGNGGGGGGDAGGARGGDGCGSGSGSGSGSGNGSSGAGGGMTAGLRHRPTSVFGGGGSRGVGQMQPRSASPTLQAYESAGKHDAGLSGYVQWPLGGPIGSAVERAAYFDHLRAAAAAAASASSPGTQPLVRQATSLLELMVIRAYHSKTLRRYSLGTAIGLRTRGGRLTDLPAIIVFVSRKVHRQWLLEVQLLPEVLHGPGGLWCDIDVVEFSYYGPSTNGREQLYSELMEGLRGADPNLGPGSQVASEEIYGTFGAIVQSRHGRRAIGFLTNCHVAVDIGQPRQRLYHPLPPSLGPGVYLGAVEVATSFASDHSWYGIFAGQNPETFVRVDGAFIPFNLGFNYSRLTTHLKGIGQMGPVYSIDLASPISSVIGQQVSKVGRSSGVTHGVLMGYAVEYNDDKGVCFFTDFLILGENKHPFDLEGDSGSLILLDPGSAVGNSAGGSSADGAALPRPFGIIWGGTANRGRVKLRSGYGPENWTSGVDLGRLLDLLELDLISTPEELKAALAEQETSGTGRRAAAEPLTVSGGGGGGDHQSTSAAVGPPAVTGPSQVKHMKFGSGASGSAARLSTNPEEVPSYWHEATGGGSVGGGDRIGRSSSPGGSGGGVKRPESVVGLVMESPDGGSSPELALPQVKRPKFDLLR